MTDVRLTALNPEDSKVYPVACNASGELITTKSGDINLDVPGNLDVGGTGTFKRNVNVGDTSTSSGGIQISAAGYLYLRSAGADAATPVIDVYDLNNTKSAGINADGSIVTRSSISAAAGYSGGNAAAQQSGVIIDSNGYITASCTVGGVFVAYTSGEATPTLSLNADGSVQFAGNKAGFTADGHLWCTTRRGDTVVLDSTDNGLGAWAVYTPPTRRDILEEKIDQLNNKPETEPETETE